MGTYCRHACKANQAIIIICHKHIVQIWCILNTSSIEARRINHVSLGIDKTNYHWASRSKTDWIEIKCFPQPYIISGRCAVNYAKTGSRKAQYWNFKWLHISVLCVCQCWLWWQSIAVEILFGFISIMQSRLVRFGQIAAMFTVHTQLKWARR